MIKYAFINVNDIKIFYREAGKPSTPAFILFHGFPSSSAMFNELIPILAKHYHVIAMDYPGFGMSDCPSTNNFAYTFDNLTTYVQKLIDQLGIHKFYMYVFDYGAPIGFRIASQFPERILGIVSQNGNIYKSGLGPKWAQRAQVWQHPTSDSVNALASAFAPETIKNQYQFGEPRQINPDKFNLDIFFTHSSGYQKRQLALIMDYQNNIQLYQQFDNYIERYQPKLLAVWGKNDPSFIYPGAEEFAKHDQNAKVTLLDAGHFALVANYKSIGNMILNFFEK
ncbi:alpha/beta hydrolase (plasmid) [Nicoliella spurrieriana]|uniref:Alpha/beta hydrolase n=1 Tax=Nicoliella spurrieriana TaxID=2925830 RepID=A0A976RQP5_9LACO|nr:alpha/beta hydrolase [Nicoliella spurrieriana]UQS86050.1 alpha/beta hydrolase [Nicoliella spurrieriana]